MTRGATLAELARFFLRLGATSFGGPAAHVALMEEELVRRRGWLEQAEFLDLLGAANLVPGPNSTELAIHVGAKRAGFAGLLVAGACFILPAMLLTGGLAWAYVRWGTDPTAIRLLTGVKPVILALVARAILNLLPTAARTGRLRLIGVAALAAALLRIDELLILLVAGALAMPRPRVTLGLVPFWPAAAATPTLGGIFLVFAKIGAVLYGSGYVLVAFLRTELVERRGWLTEAQLLDAVAAGQVTPGPVFSTATFVGWLLGGPVGAVVATVGIFLPAFVYVAASTRLVGWMRRSPAAAGFLDGVNVASVALMAAVLLDLGRGALTAPWTAAVAVVATVLLVRTRINPTWWVLGGALIGLAVG